MTNNQVQPGAAPVPPVAGQPDINATNPTEISLLARQRQEAREAVPAPVAPQAQGTPTPTSGTDPNSQSRSEYIPRERFDQVLAQKQEAERQADAYRQYVENFRVAQQYTPQQLVPPIPQAQPQYTQGGQYIPQTAPIAQPAAQAQAQAVAQGLLARVNDTDEVKRWQKRITDNPLEGLSALVKQVIDEYGAPLVEQRTQQLYAQLAPIQQSMVSQQVQAYASQRQADPTWSQVRPAFEALVHRASAGNYPINGQTLPVLEAVARSQTGVPMFGAPPVQQAPFSERPGTAAGFGSAQPQGLSQDELRVAKAFGMTPEAYAASKAQRSQF